MRASPSPRLIVSRTMVAAGLLLSLGLLLVSMQADSAVAQTGTASSVPSQSMSATPDAAPEPVPPRHPLVVRIMKWIFYGIIGLICVYLVRHWIFALNRVLGRQRHPYLDIDTAEWPAVTVLVPAHNEELVIADILEALTAVDYPRDRLRVIPVNDRSSDRTAEIIDHYAGLHPDLFHPFHRQEGQSGKSAALGDAMELVHDDIVLVFDADYIPGEGLLKQLVAPFFDPEVGAVMGRVVPLNAAKNLLTRALDMERSGGYQVDQQARMNLHLVPQYGGTVGGVRKSAAEAVGGWNPHALAEDTDVTIRLLIGGWKTVYQNRSECYEQVPESWRARMGQIFRWARGHNQVLQAYGGKVLRCRHLRFWERLDALLLLNTYVMSLVLLIGWGLGIVLWYLGVLKATLLIILAVTSYSTLGNFALFFEIATATHLDGAHNRIRLLPFIMLGFIVTLMAVTRATLTQFLEWRRRDEVLWHKTERTERRTAW